MGKSLAEQMIEKKMVNPERYIKTKKMCCSPAHHHHPKFCTGCPCEAECIQENMVRKYGN